MAETATLLADGVFPYVPLRQNVQTGYLYPQNYGISPGALVIEKLTGDNFSLSDSDKAMA
jgi:inorganic pyrophosphatase